MNVLDLFSGVGGFSLGLERAGMRTVAFCEIDPYCRRVLAKHWPAVPIFGDVRAVTFKKAHPDADSAGPHQTEIDQQGKTEFCHGQVGEPGSLGRALGERIDVICGGFPCQDISVAGKGAGITGSRSGLWKEYARIIGEVRPRYVIVENVAALLSRGLGDVLGDLAALGYDAEWHCIPASAVGAPHRRDRIWIIAYARGEQYQSAGDADQRSAAARFPEAALADSHRPRFSFARAESNGEDGEHSGGMLAASGWWSVEPDVGRVAHGVPSRVDRLKALGNAIVPQIAEIIGRAIMAAELSSKARKP